MQFIRDNRIVTAWWEYKCKRFSQCNNDDIKEDVDKETRSKLKHLSKREFALLWPVFKKFNRVFAEPKDNIGWGSIVTHKIDAGDHPPVWKNPYRLPHALKSMMNDQLSDICVKGRIRSLDSLWTSAVVVVNKKSYNGIPKYRFLPNIVVMLSTLSGL